MTVNRVRDKELTLVDAEGVESKYVFTKQHNDLDSARIETNSQAPADYWFDVETTDDPIEPILSVKDNAIDLPTDFNDLFKQSTIELTTNVARKRAKR